jgi:hypothetical protein
MKKDLVFGKNKRFFSVLCMMMVRRIVGTVMMLMLVQGVWAANRYSVATGNWNSTSTWAETAGGAAGASVPVAGDAVYIQSGKNVTVTADAAATSITFTGAAATLTVNATLTVSGAVILLHNVGNATACLITGSGTLSCASVDAGSDLSLNGDYSAILTSTLHAFNVSGNVTMIAKESGPNYGQAGFRVEDGTTTVGGQVTSSLGTGCSGALRMTGVTTGSQTGTLVLSGTTPWGTLTAITVVLNGTGATVEYNGSSTQTVLGTTYTHLRINISGTASLGGNTTVNGTFYKTKGTFALNGKTLTYGASASLNYNGTTAQTTGPEWPSSFNKPVTISNTGGVVTLGSNTFTGTSATTTINSGATLATGAGTYTNAGALAINGSFQINQAGWATNAVSGSPSWTFTNGTLIFNNSSGSFGVNSGDVFWPTTNGPTNVTVLGAGGITMNAARTVSGTFQTSAGVVNANNLTFNGIAKLNTGGSFTGSPTYGSSSTLIYNTGGTYGRNAEWNATSGAGYPANVQISNNTTLNYPNGSNAAKSISGNLTIDVGSALYMDYDSPGMNNPLTVGGNLANYGSLSLGDVAGGDLKIYGNIIDNGAFYANNRAIFFNGGNTQDISGSGTFDISYVRINKTGGSVRLLSNLLCEGPNTGNAMEIDGALSILDLNGFTLTLGKAGVATTYNSGIATPGVIKGSSTSNISILGTGALGTINFDQTTPGTTNALQNLTINRTSTGTVTLGNSLAVNGTLTLTEGTLSGTLSYGTDGILNYNGTSYTTTTDVEFPASNGPKTLTITSAHADGLTLHATRTLAGDLTIGSSQKFIIPDDKDLTVDGATVTNNGLYLKSPATGYGRTASFWPKGTTSGNVHVERSIPGWTSDTDGWNFLSAPVSGQSIAPNFTIANPNENKYDFYRWDESDATTPWHNYKADVFTSFTPGEGYLVAYDDNAIKNFSGPFNNDAIPLSNLSYSTGAYKGWHLLGNPYTCALSWNNGDWVLSNVEAIAQIMNPGGTYTPISAGNHIPALNGFMVHVNGSLNSLTIPLSARTHSATDWYKNSNTMADRLMLTAKSNGNNTYVETIIKLDQDATPAFDMEFDGHFLRGIEGAPQLYSLMSDNDKLCVNTLPQNQDTRDVSLGFVKGNAEGYTLTTSGIETFSPGVSIRLEDLKAGQSQDLRENPIYSFTAADGDNANRFILHFGGAYSTNDLTNPGHINIFTSGNQIFISGLNNGKTTGNVLVYNLLGQQIAAGSLDQSSKCLLNLDAPAGYYLVKVVTPEISKTSKVYIN